MSRRAEVVRWFGVVLLFTATFIALPPPVFARAPQGGGGQRGSASQPVAPTGPASIAVSVVSDDGAGVKGALVYAMPMPAAPTGFAAAPGQAAVAPMAPAVRDRGRGQASMKSARTGPGGYALVADLPVGSYGISVVPPTGFINRGALSRVEATGGRPASVTITLGRAGVITGRVLDEDGDPVTGAVVSVVRVSRVGGRVESSSPSTQPTNDLGVFRVWSLAAGDYIVGTHYEERQRPSATDGPVVDSYIPTYFPGVASFDASRAVQVRAGQETAGVDIQLVRGRMGTVTGRVVDSAGAAAGPGGSVQLLSRGYNPTFSSRGSGIRADGTFTIPSVPAGDYLIHAVPAGGRGANASREAGYAPVSVNGEEVFVTVHTNAGATVSGRVVFEGNPPARAGGGGATARLPQVRVMARSTSDWDRGSSQAAVARPDGTFTLSGLRGLLQFSAAGDRAAFKAVRRGAADITGQALEFLGTERIDDLVLVLTYDTGEIEAVIDDDSDQPFPDATALLVPDDPDKWGAGSPFVRTARVSSIGTSGGTAGAVAPGSSTGAARSSDASDGFRFNTLPAGRYLVVAFADGGAPASPDRATLERLRELGRTVTVTPGQTATVKVSAVR